MAAPPPSREVDVAYVFIIPDIDDTGKVGITITYVEERDVRMLAPKLTDSLLRLSCSPGLTTNTPSAFAAMKLAGANMHAIHAMVAFAEAREADDVTRRATAGRLADTWRAMDTEAMAFMRAYVTDQGGHSTHAEVVAAVNAIRADVVARARKSRDAKRV